MRAVAAAGITGLLTYVYLAIASRSLGPAEFDQFSVFWSIALVLGFGFFLPVEQELARVGGPTGSVAAGRAALRVASEFSLVLVVLFIAPMVIWSAWLNVGYGVIVACALVAAVSSVQYTARGVMHTQGWVRRFADVLVLDSGLRVVGALLLVLTTFIVAVQANAVEFAIGIPLAILIAHAWLLRPLRKEPPPIRPEINAFRRATLSLVGASLAAQLLANAGPIVIQALSQHAGEAGAFQASFNLARVPLLLVTPLQGILIAPLAGMVRRGDSHRLIRAMVRVCALVAVLAIVGAILGWLIGPWLVDLVFGPGRALSGGELAILIAGVCCYVGLVVCTQALVALSRHPSATLLWLSALLVAALSFFLLVVEGGVVLAFSVGFAVGSLTGLSLALVVLWSGRGRTVIGLVEEERFGIDADSEREHPEHS